MVTFGRSLGGAVAISLAERFPDLVSGIVVENTFLSIGAMVDVLMPFLRHIKSLVLFMRWDSGAKIVALKMPILFIAGTVCTLCMLHAISFTHEMIIFLICS